MEIYITPHAHEDILNIYDYVKKDGESIAKRQVSLIYDAIENLGEFPNIGIPVQKYVVKETDLKFLVIRKVYIVIYRIDNAIRVIRVFRKEQDFISVLDIGDNE